MYIYIYIYIYIHTIFHGNAEKNISKHRLCRGGVLDLLCLQCLGGLHGQPHSPGAINGGPPNGWFIREHPTKMDDLD